MAKSPYSPTGQTSGFGSIKTAGAYSLTGITQKFDTQLPHGASDITEQFKGLPATGFTPGANQKVGGGLSVPQRLRLMFVELVKSGMSHSEAAKHIQRTTGLHARTGQRIVAKVEKTKTGKIKYAGLYSTKKHYKGTGARSGHHKPRHQSPFGTPAGLK